MTEREADIAAIGDRAVLILAVLVLLWIACGGAS